MTEDQRTMFVNLQHPGDGNPALTNFPLLNAVPDGVTIPRDATVVITRKDGGRPLSLREQQQRLERLGDGIGAADPN